MAVASHQLDVLLCLVNELGAEANYEAGFSPVSVAARNGHLDIWFGSWARCSGPTSTKRPTMFVCINDCSPERSSGCVAVPTKVLGKEFGGRRQPSEYNMEAGTRNGSLSWAYNHKIMMLTAC